MCERKLLRKTLYFLRSISNDVWSICKLFRWILFRSNIWPVRRIFLQVLNTYVSFLCDATNSASFWKKRLLNFNLIKKSKIIAKACSSLFSYKVHLLNDWGIMLHLKSWMYTYYKWILTNVYNKYIQLCWFIKGGKYLKEMFVLRFASKWLLKEGAIEYLNFLLFKKYFLDF